MRNELVTAFWQKAARSLPAPYRERYQSHFVRAEQWELAFGEVADLVSRAKSRLARSVSSRAHSA